MKILLIVATAIAIIPIILSLFVKDMYLSDKYVTQYLQRAHFSTSSQTQ